MEVSKWWDFISSGFSADGHLTIESSRKLQPRISAVSTMLLSGLQVATSRASYNEAARQKGFKPKQCRRTD